MQLFHLFDLSLDLGLQLVDFALDSFHRAVSDVRVFSLLMTVHEEALYFLPRLIAKYGHGQFEADDLARLPPTGPVLR